MMQMKKWFLFTALLCAVLLGAGEAPRLTAKGVELDFGAGGRQTLLFPQFKTSDGKNYKPQVELDGNSATIRYEGVEGAPTVRLQLDDGGMSEEVSGNRIDGHLQWELHIPIDWSARGGAFALPADGAFKTLPKELNAEKPVLAGGGFSSLALRCGESITIQLKPGCYWQLQDNRAWKWNIYALVMIQGLPAPGQNAVTQWSIGAEVKDAASLPVLTDKGVQLDFGLGGKISLDYPSFRGEDGKNIRPAVDRSGNQLTLRYPDVANSPVVALKLDGSALYGTVTGNGAKGQLLWESHLPIMWHKEGAFAMPAGGTEKKFPQLFTRENTQLGNGNFKAVTFRCGNTVTLLSEPGCYWQLQDNRAWKWNVYALVFFWAVPGAGQTINYRLDIANEKPREIKVQVDRFGQSTAVNWPGKITSEEELKADLAADKEYYGGMTPPADRDRFGGFTGVQLEATGFFRIGKWNDRDILITPDGHPIYHLAVCSAGGPCDDYTYVKGREAIYEWLPGPEDEMMKSAYLRGERESFSFYLANYIRKTGKPFDVEAWRDDVFMRYKKLGFNSQGAFAADVAAGVRNEFPVTRSLPLSEWLIPHGAMGGIVDPFDPKSVEKMDQLFSKLAADADNPFIVGYFIQNERPYSEIPRKLAGLSDASAAKREFVRDLEKKYGSIEKFNAAWETDVADFAAAAREVLPVKNKTAWQDVAEFSAKFYETYFKLVHDTFRKYDKNHLLLGDRFLPGETNSADLVAACGRYNDVFSVNYYTQSIDPEFLRQLHEKAGRPLMLSEWSFGTAEEGLSGGCITVKDQKERGEAYRNYVEQTAVLPFVIGTQWFAALDQALTGRFFQYYNGENMNIGLFNVADRPFKDFHDAVRETNYSIYDLLAGKREPFVWSGGTGAVRQRRSLLVPHAAAGHKVDGVRMPWPTRPSERIDKAQLLMGQNKGNVRGDFWLCWDEKNLYLFIDVNDPTPCLGAKKPESFWNGDGIELFLGAEAPDEGGELRFTDRQLLISATPGAGAYWAKQSDQKPVQVVVLPFPDGKGYSLEAAIPWNALGVTEPKTGMKLRFDLALDNSDGEKRIEQFMWSGTAYNHSDRSMWGTATLVD